MRHWLLRARAVRLSASGLALVLALDVWILWRATHIRVASPSGGSPAGSAAVTVPEPVAGYSFQRVLASTAKDPFHPERRRPRQRFQPPPDPGSIAANQTKQQVPAGVLRLIGTAVAPNGGGFAMCEAPGGAPRIVRIGEQVGGWTLQKVTPGSAEFATPTGLVVLHVPKAGS